MLNRYKVYVLCLWAIVFTQGLAQEWIWPTSASKWLTSSFCELRPRRYHAGWDVKTWGKTGYPVYAMKDGYVWRVRVSPSGYGKVIYIKHADGYFSVYAHLSKFMDSLETLVRTEQVKTHQYIQEFYFKPQQFPVKQGDVIAFSGDTGIGYPHLHFEIRDSHHHPLFPGKYFQSILMDNFPPVFKGLVFKPEEFTGSVNGELGPWTSNKLNRIQKNHFVLDSEPVIFGPFSIEFYAIDRMKVGFNRLNYHRAKLFIDSKLVSDVLYDTLNYAYNHQIELERDFVLSRRGYSRFRSFKKSPHFKQNFYKYLLGDGTIRKLSIGRHYFTIQIYDVAGNSSRLTGYFHWYPVQPAVSIKNKTSDSVCIRLNPFYDSTIVKMQYLQYQSPEKVVSQFEVNAVDYSDSVVCTIPLDSRKKIQALRIRNIFPGGASVKYFLPLFAKSYSDGAVYVEKVEDFPEYYLLHIKGEPIISHPDYEKLSKNFPMMRIKWKSPQSLVLKIHKKELISLDSLKIRFGSKTIFLPLKQALVYQGKSSRIAFPDSIFSVKFYKNTVFDSMFVNIRKFPSQILPGDTKYPLVAPVYKVETQTVPLNDIATIAFKPDSLPVKNRSFPVYFDQKSGKWLFLPFNTNADSSQFFANVFSMEFFSMALDTIPPIISMLHSGKWSKVGNGVSFRVTDEYSGIKSMKQIRVFIDSEPVLFIYDPEKKIITIPPYVLKKGRHVVVVVVQDNAGNESRDWNEVIVP